MKQVLLQRLSGSATIRTPSYSADAMGGRTVSGTVETVVDCLAEPMSAASEGEYAGILKSRQGYIVTVPAGTGVSIGATVVVGGVTLEVVALDVPLTNEPLRRVVCAKVS